MIIRATIKAVDILADFNGLEFPPPGGIFTWKIIRVTNYSPFLCQITHTSDASNTPPQFIAPWQQNIYQYSGSKGNITTKPTSLTLTPTNLHGFFMVEFCDDENGFPGYYPVPLVGQILIETKGALGTIKEIDTATPAKIQIINPFGPLVTINDIGATGGSTVDSVTLTGGTGGYVTPATGEGPDVVIHFGGGGNTFTGTANFIVGATNQINGGTNLIAGSSNKLTNNADKNLLVGQTNTLKGPTTSSNANVVTGSHNTLTTSRFSVVIGLSNTVTKTTDSLIGGHTNSVITSTSVATVGNNNTVSHSHTTLIAGGSNKVVGTTRSVVAGLQNTVHNVNGVTLGTGANAAYDNSLTAGSNKTGTKSQFVEMSMGLLTNGTGAGNVLLTLQKATTTTNKLIPATTTSYAVKITVSGHENVAATTKLKTFAAEYRLGLTPKGTSPAHYAIATGGPGSIIYGHDYTPTFAFSVINTVTIAGAKYSQLEITVTGPAAVASYSFKIEMVMVG